jgi:hypothetical protein
MKLAVSRSTSEVPKTLVPRSPCRTVSFHMDPLFEQGNTKQLYSDAIVIKDVCSSMIVALNCSENMTYSIKSVFVSVGVYVFE